MQKLNRLLLVLGLVCISATSFACSIFYYIDPKTGNIYFVNNEDYWYDVKAYMQIIPASKNKLGRIWYGWDHFGQGGVNEKGLVMDGAVTPEQKIPPGYTDPTKGNITDEILAECETVQDAIDFLERRKIALTKGHIFFGDKHGRAVIVEWVDGKKNIVEIQNNRLIATNFNLSDTSQTPITCWRYPAIQNGLDDLDAGNAGDTLDLKTVGNVIGKAVQIPQTDSTGKIGGTLYTTFIDISAMQLVLVYQLDNSKKYELNILTELQKGKKRKIKLY